MSASLRTAVAAPIFHSGRYSSFDVYGVDFGCGGGYVDFHDKFPHCCPCVSAECRADCCRSATGSIVVVSVALAVGPGPA